MQEIYSTPISLLILLTVILFVVLAAVLLKLNRLRKQLKVKDYVAGAIFIPIFSMLFFMSVFHTSKIIFASNTDRSEITGKLISTELLPTSQSVEQTFLLVKLEDSNEAIHEIKVSDVINPFSYTHTKGEASLFNKIGSTYKVSFVKEMIVKIQEKQQRSQAH